MASETTVQRLELSPISCRPEQTLGHRRRREGIFDPVVLEWSLSLTPLGRPPLIDVIRPRNVAAGTAPVTRYLLVSISTAC
jgi:hypothetical protein